MGVENHQEVGKGILLFLHVILEDRNTFQLKGNKINHDIHT